MSDVLITRLTRFEEFLACEDIQRQAWGMDTDRDIVPAHMLRPVHEYGGIILGAYTPEKKLVGFVFGFTGRISDPDDRRGDWMGTPYLHCSEMMGVLPEYRGQSVGLRLKQEQRKQAMAQGHRLMIWTFDPLLSLNAWLNINKLGCIIRSYIRDAYGQLSGMYAGLPTDRFEVEWWLCSDRVRQLMGDDHQSVGGEGTPLSLSDWLDSGAQQANPASLRADGLPVPSDTVRLNNAPALLVEIPADFQAVRASDMGLASAWRMHTRALFEEAFGGGYVAAAFVSETVEGVRRSYYVLKQGINIEAMAGEQCE